MTILRRSEKEGRRKKIGKIEGKRGRKEKRGKKERCK